MADDSLKIASSLGNVYQIKYARRINRTFDNQKLEGIIGKTSFMKVNEGLKLCLNDFLEGSRVFKPINWKAHAYFDLLAREHTELKEFSSREEKIKYMVARYTPFFYLRKGTVKSSAQSGRLH